MKKIETLKKNYQFKRILTKGRRYFGSYIDIIVIPNNKENNYIGIAISSRLAKAVKRNKLKRLIREAYRLTLNDIKQGYSFVFLCKKTTNIAKINFSEVLNDIQQLFRKAGLYK